MREYRRADRAAEMMLTLAPIDAGAAERTFVALEVFDFDAEPDQELTSLSGEVHDVAVPTEHSFSDPALEETYGDSTGEMIIAGPGIPHRLFLGARARPQVPDSRCHRHQRLDTVRNIGIGKAEVARSAFFSTDDDPGEFELREMHAGGR